MTELETGFLQYARNVIDPPSAHVAACISASGATTLAGLEPTLRWPGYVGKDYERAAYRLLCVAQVHHAVDLQRTLGPLQDEMRTWRTGALGDDVFLDRLRNAYANAIPGWGPWKKTFQFIASNFGLFAEDVAYTNLAKCWQTLDQSAIAPVRTCAGHYRLTELSATLKPHAIVVLGGDEIQALIDQYGPADPRPVVVKMRWSYDNLAASIKRLEEQR